MQVEFRTRGIYDVSGKLARSCMYDKLRGAAITVEVKSNLAPSQWTLSSETRNVDLSTYFCPRGTWPTYCTKDGTIRAQINLPYNVVDQLPKDDTYEIQLDSCAASDCIYFVKDKEMVWHERSVDSTK